MDANDYDSDDEAESAELGWLDEAEDLNDDGEPEPEVAPHMRAFSEYFGTEGVEGLRAAIAGELERRGGTAPERQQPAAASQAPRTAPPDDESRILAAIRRGDHAERDRLRAERLRSGLAPGRVGEIVGARQRQ
jgi:hypothetical protein